VAVLSRAAVVARALTGDDSDGGGALTGDGGAGAHVGDDDGRQRRREVAAASARTTMARLCREVAAAMCMADGGVGMHGGWRH
jgi:hypothetical protein